MIIKKKVIVDSLNLLIGTFNFQDHGIGGRMWRGGEQGN